MKNVDDTIHPVQILNNWNPLPRETLASWVEVAARHGFDAILPLIEQEGIDVVNRTLRQGAIDWLFLAGVSSWNRALLIGSDLGAAVEALMASFQKLVVVEPNDLLHRLLEIRFQVEIAAGRLHLKKEALDQTDVDLDLLWFMPTIGRSRGSLPLTAELKAVLQDCTTRLAPGGVLVARVIRDRGPLRDVPLPVIRYEPGRGYSLREFEQVFRSTRTKENGTLEWYWLMSRNNGRSFGTKLQSQTAISYCIRRNSKWFDLMGPLAEFGVTFVTKRVSSLMLVFRKNVELSSALKPVRTEPKTNRNRCILQRVMQAVRERHQDCRELAPVLYRSGTLRRDGRAMFLLVDPEIGRPMYIVRIAKGPESELRLRNEHQLYQVLRQSNQALKSLNPVHYFISDNSDTLSLPDPYSSGHKHIGNSFSIERFLDGITGAAFARQSFLDTYSLEWLNWFQKESETAAGGVFDNQVLCSELSVLQDTILKGADASIANGTRTKSLRCRIPHDLLKSLFVDLDCRFKGIQSFRLPFSAVHGDFCQLNLLAYNPMQDNAEFIYPRRQGTELGEFSSTHSHEQLRIHVFDWEYLEMGVPLLDPWLYVIVCLYLSIQGQANRQVIQQFLTGRWKYSDRVERCLAYYARISGIPVDLLGGYLPLALLIVYAREAARSGGNLRAVELFEETIISLAMNRREVWHYLDALTKRLEKELPQ